MKKTKICIVGGGTAGWVTLSYLAATLDVDLCIIHSDEIEKINVGESTSPTIKHITDTIGIDEADWMRQSNATFKYGVEFNDFAQIGSKWFHSFDDLIPDTCFNTPLCDNGKITYTSNVEQYLAASSRVNKHVTSVDYFLKLYNRDCDKFNRAHGPFSHMVDLNLSPYTNNMIDNSPKFPGVAYHINTYKFGESLKQFTDTDRYEEIIETVVDVDCDDHGVSCVTLSDGRKIHADIFFDCTGFHRLLINKYSDWMDFEDLKNNSAVWGYIPNTYSFKPVTGAHAQSAGWIWEVPTYGQIGTGYVYCDEYCNEESAIETVTDFWSKRGHNFEYLKSVKFQAGRHAHTSIKNIICNGLSQSFIEPLEATSIMIICTTIKCFVDMYKKRGMWDHRRSRAHCSIMNKFIDHTKQFVLYHYKLTKRRDTQYWRDVQGDPDDVKYVCNYIDNLARVKWVNKGQTLLNQWNWTSMLLGYEHEFINGLKDISVENLSNYEYYINMMEDHYKHILRNNLTTKEFLIKINE